MIKRLMDIAGASLGLAVLSPVLVATAGLIALRLGRPVLFRQMRPGKDGRPFEMVKFRTMTDPVDEAGNLRSEADRLTPFGRTLRAASLDELPELWNVLRGDMSLVGPRPLLMAYLERYSPEQARRHEVRPGLTGWAQISGRNALSWDDKFALDIWYIDNRSFWLDCRILFATAMKVLRRDGINSADATTMPEFMGERERGGGDRSFRQP